MRTLNDITPPSRRKDFDSGSDAGISERTPLRLVERPPKFPFVTLLSVFIIIAASVGTLFYFSSAQVEVTASTASAAVQGSFTANQSTGTLPYEIITAQKIATQSVKGNGTKTVSSSASGTLTIYNTQTKAQHLVANTRFATTAGLIFRIHSSVTIPGGSTSRPGSLSVKVYADQPGSTYNVAPTSFTVPGFAGTPQESQVYARSTTAMAGGASGTIPVVDATLESETRAALVKALAPDLASSIQKQIPEGYTLLDGSATTTYQVLDSAPSVTAGMVDVKEQGTVTAVVFPTAALAKAVASSIPGLSNQNVSLTLAPTSALHLTAPNLPDPTAATFTFMLTGTAVLNYVVDPATIAAAVAGKTRSAAEVALTNYPEVKRAILTLRPFWRQTFPEDPASITVVVDKP